MDRLMTGGVHKCADKTRLKNKKNMMQNEAENNGWDESIEARELERGTEIVIRRSETKEACRKGAKMRAQSTPLEARNRTRTWTKKSSTIKEPTQ